MTAQRGDFALPGFQFGGCPLPWLFCRKAQDGQVVFEAATGMPVKRWRLENVVPAPGAKAVQR